MPAKFQRRHYLAIADVIASLRAESDLFDQPAIDRMVDATCRVFRRDNARFDEERYRQATKA